MDRLTDSCDRDSAATAAISVLENADRVVARVARGAFSLRGVNPTVVEVDVTRIARLRDRAKNDFAQREGTKLSFLPFFALAAVEAIQTHGALKGFVLGLWRVMRCNPWNGGGLDPVPTKGHWKPDVLANGEPRHGTMDSHGHADPRV